MHCTGHSTIAIERFCRANVRNDFRVPGCENYCERSREICVLHVFRSKTFSRALACLRSTVSGLHPIIFVVASGGT